MSFSDERAIWLGRQVLPHEPSLRAWLSRRRLGGLDVDDIIQETNRQPCDTVQFRIIDVPILHNESEIDGAKVAGFIRIERLLTAGVGGFNRTARRNGICCTTVDAVNKNKSGIACLPGCLYNFLKNFTSA